MQKHLPLFIVHFIESFILLLSSFMVTSQNESFVLTQNEYIAVKCVGL